jgi:ABC-type branched-subunit amino acid transport system permease subunit
LLGHAAFFGSGAYTSGLLALNLTSFWLSFLWQALCYAFWDAVSLPLPAARHLPGVFTLPSPEITGC